RPGGLVGFVGGVVGALFGHLHLVVGENEGADGGVEREAVNAVAGGVDEHGRRTVDDVAGGNLFGAGQQDGFLEWLAGNALVDGEDGADVDVDVDVGGAVERVEDDDVSARLRVGVDDDGLFVFFADKCGHAVAATEDVEENFVGVDVELLLDLALHVDGANGTESVTEAAPTDFGFDHLGGQRDAAEQPAEGAAGLGKVLLLAPDVLLHGRDHLGVG